MGSLPLSDWEVHLKPIMRVVREPKGGRDEDDQATIHVTLTFSPVLRVPEVHEKVAGVRLR